MEEVVILGKILGFSFFVTKFAPFQWTMDLFEINEKSNPYKILFHNTISILLGCFSCCSFWTGFFTFGLWYAVSAYVIAYFYNQLIAPFVDKIRLQ